MVALVQEGEFDDSEDRAVAVDEPERRAAHRQTVDQIGGPVNGVERPERLVLLELLRAFLLPQEADARSVLAQEGTELPLDGVVEVGGEVAVALGGHGFWSVVQESCAGDVHGGPGDR